MRQYQAVEKISKKAIEDGLVEAIIIKGSLARGTEDEYSDVDLYFIVKEEKNIDDILEKRLEYLSAYLPVMYHKLVYFVSSQVVCVFDDGLHVDLYVTTYEKLSHVDDYAVIYDPKNIFSNYKKISLMMSPTEIGELINSYCFTSIEFYASYKRNDLIFSLRLANHLSALLGTFLRTHFDPDFAKLGIKNLLNKLDSDNKKRYIDIIKRMKIDSVLESVQMMYVLFDGYINKLPLKIVEYVNLDFYIYTKKLIMSIDK